MSIPIKRKPGTVRKPLSTQKSSPTIRDIEGPSDQTGACSDIQSKATSTCSTKTQTGGIKAVVNVRSRELRLLGFNDLEHWLQDPNNVYIGRDMTHYVPGAVGSKWGNPYQAKKYGRDESFHMYKDYLKSTPALYDSLEELCGKIVGCWCHPDKCHGHILRDTLDEKLSKKDATS